MARAAINASASFARRRRIPQHFCAMVNPPVPAYDRLEFLIDWSPPESCRRSGDPPNYGLLDSCLSPLVTRSGDGVSDGMSVNWDLWTRGGVGVELLSVDERLNRVIFAGGRGRRGHE